MKFIELHWSDTNNVVWVNPANITYMHWYKGEQSSYTIVAFAGQGSVIVKEAPEIIISMSIVGGSIGMNSHIGSKESNLPGKPKYYGK